MARGRIVETLVTVTAVTVTVVIVTVGTVEDRLDYNSLSGGGH